MKAIICELCGSNDLKKINGEYECQYCHTKYTVDEAKKLMIEGTVNVQGIVSIDESMKQENYETLAKRAFENKIYDQASEYYTKLLEMNPNNWEYIYKKGICSAFESTLANPRIEGAVKSCESALNVIKMSKLEVDESEVRYEMARDLNNVAVSFYKLAQEHYMEFRDMENSIEPYWDSIKECILVNEYAITIFRNYLAVNERNKNEYVSILKNLIVYYHEICERRRYIEGHGSYGEAKYGWKWCDKDLRTETVIKYDKYVNEIKRLEPNYKPQDIVRQIGGCYIATCVYGSYDCQEVWTLRRYRDYELYESWQGRLFIKIYYAVSPTIVRLFGKTKWFNKIFKSCLDKFVSKLKLQGYNSTPYQDRF